MHDLLRARVSQIKACWDGKRAPSDGSDGNPACEERRPIASSLTTDVWRADHRALLLDERSTSEGMYRHGQGPRDIEHIYSTHEVVASFAASQTLWRRTSRSRIQIAGVQIRVRKRGSRSSMSSTTMRRRSSFSSSGR